MAREGLSPRARARAVGREAAGETVARRVRGRLRPYEAAGAVLGAAVLACTAADVTLAAPTPPRAASSHYVTRLSVRQFKTWGCNMGKSRIDNAVVIFDFGRPATSADPTVFRHKLPNYNRPTFATFSGIVFHLKQFSNAYHNCWQQVREGSVKIVWGTNNVIPDAWETSGEAAAGYPKAKAHARALAQEVKEYHTWLRDSSVRASGNIFNRQAALAGSDIEQYPFAPDYYSKAAPTRAYVDGYNSFGATRKLFVNYGSNEVGDCLDAAACGYNAWTARDAYYVSRSAVGSDGTRKSRACPQIYSDAKITHWTKLQRFALTQPGPNPQILFYCVTASRGPDIDPAFTPGVAWSRFYDALMAIGSNANTLHRQLTFFRPLSES